MNSYVTYEVNLTLKDNEVESSIHEWLLGHIKDMEAIEGILFGTKLLETLSTLDASEPKTFSVQYQFDSEDRLKWYLREKAPEMRSHLSEELKAKVVFSRRVLKPAGSL